MSETISKYIPTLPCAFNCCGCSNEKLSGCCCILCILILFLIMAKKFLL